MDAQRSLGCPPATVASAQACILIADDERAIREVLRLALEEEGYPVVEAADGQRTLDLLLSSPVPLVVLLDVMMPRLSGAQVLLRASAMPPLLARHAIAVLSANPALLTRFDPEVRALLVEHDIPLLAKPIDLDVLLAVVACLWERVLGS
jgi:CheY-like chemotaxis protein